MTSQSDFEKFLLANDFWIEKHSISIVLAGYMCFRKFIMYDLSKYAIVDHPFICLPVCPSNNGFAGAY